jgi:hypothetical protein
MSTRERPILFTGPMVRAIMDGRKTQTRRPIKARHDWLMCERESGVLWPHYAAYVYAEHEPVEVPCPYGAPGDMLWVKETWCGIQHGTGCRYKADWPEHEHGPRWRPSLFMPRIASRLLLRVTGVRAEQVLDITHDDARAEGVDGVGDFLALWHGIYGDVENRWVWRVDFEVVAKALDTGDGIG